MKTNKETKRQTRGFTLLEVLIVVLIIGILAIIAIPYYTHFLTKARFLNVIKAGEGYQVPVAECLQNNGYKNGDTFTLCASGTTPIPASMASGDAPFVESVTVANGIITATAAAGNGLTTDMTIKFTPAIPTTGRVFKWTSTCSTAASDVCTSVP